MSRGMAIKGRFGEQLTQSLLSLSSQFATNLAWRCQLPRSLNPLDTYSSKPAGRAVELEEVC